MSPSRFPLVLAAGAALALAACAPPIPSSAAPSARPEADGGGATGPCPAVAPGTLVDLRALDPTIATDIRYHTANNFTGAPLPGYDVPRALMRPSAARALARVQRRLRADGLGLKVFDAYRPVRATLAMVEWAERTGQAWVLELGYVARKSGHNLGSTVDLTLVRLDTGEELEMGTPFDTFSPAAHTANAMGAVLENRMRLKHAMEAEGFTNLAQEWWHFRHAGSFAPLDIPLGCFR